MLTRTIFSLGFFVTALRIDLPGRLAILVFCIAIMACATTGRTILACAILGAVTPLLPAFGSGTLLAAGLFFLISIGQRKLEPWTLPFLGIVAIDVLGQICLDPDPFVAATVWRGEVGEGGVAALLAWLRVSPPDWLVSFQLLTRLALLSGFANALRDERDWRAYENGLLLGAGAALPVVFFQAAGLLEGALPNQTSLWSHQERFAGTFTDPNAMGIFAVLLVPVLGLGLYRATSARSRFAFALLLLGWLSAALFTGSRAFLLGLVVYLSLMCWRRGKAGFFSVLLVLAGCISLLNWAQESRPEELSRLLRASPAGVQRLADTLNLPRIEAALYSRTLFWQMGVDMWLDRPVAGAGFGRFAEVLPQYLQNAGVDIGGWTDNSNNFYLGVLAELGLVGFASLALSFASIRGRGTPDARRAALMCLAILMLVGPHVDFDEIALVTGYLMAVSISSAPRGRGASLAWASVTLTAAFAFTLRTTESALGFHGLEHNGAAMFRWSGRRAAFSHACGEAITVQASNPDLATRPLAVAIEGRCGSRSVELTSNAPTAIDLPCGCDDAISSRYVLEVSRAWSPYSWQGFGPDRRILGVQVYTGSDPDLLR